MVTRAARATRWRQFSCFHQRNAKHSDLEFRFDLSLELRLDFSCLKQGNAFMLGIQIGECISHFGFWQQIFVSFCFAIFYSIFI